LTIGEGIHSSIHGGKKVNREGPRTRRKETKCNHTRGNETVTENVKQISSLTLKRKSKERSNRDQPDLVN
jgi:hypothetical protein